MTAGFCLQMGFYTTSHADVLSSRLIKQVGAETRDVELLYWHGMNCKHFNYIQLQPATKTKSVTAQQRDLALHSEHSEGVWRERI